MILQNFIIYTGYCVDLYFNDRTVRINFNEWTGNIYKRSKLHPILKYFVDHKGLYIGQLNDGTHLLVHNHVDPGTAAFVDWQNFAGNQQVLPDLKACTNTPEEMVTIALQQILNRKPYSIPDSTCQTLVNQACHNERKNDDTGRIIGGALLLFAISGALNSLFGKK
jgi:hypothetical protein